MSLVILGTPVMLCLVAVLLLVAALVADLQSDPVAVPVPGDEQ